MWKSFKRGVITGAKQWRVALIVYSIQLLMAITIGLQVYQVLEASIGHSIEIEKLLKGFDNTVFTDFLNVHGASITPLIGQLRYLILVYLTFSVFINSGILSNVVKKEYSWLAFWQGAARFFFPFLKMTLIFLLLLLLWTMLLWGPVLLVLLPGVENFSSEVPMVQLSVAALLIYLLGIVFVFNWSVAAKIHYIREKGKIWAKVRSGLKWNMRHYLAATGLFLIFAFFQFLLLSSYVYFGQNVGMTSPLLIFFFLIIQQLLVYMRILWRIMLYSGLHQLIN